jgi:protein SCO1
VLAAALTWLVILGTSASGAPGTTAVDATPDDSVYQLTGSLIDQAGQTVHLDVHRGHPVLLSMFYTSCADACPLLIAELQRIEAGLPPALRADVRVVLVSLDPERDTPRALRRLAESHRLDTTRWRLLTGSDDTVREVAAVLGVKFRRLANGMINHSSVIAVLDRRGGIEGTIDGITPGDPKLLARVTAALARAARGAGRSPQVPAPPAPPRGRG